MPTKTAVQIRWIIKRDLPDVLVIEKESFEYPWLTSDFTNCLCQRNCIGLVAEFQEKIVGYMIYEIRRTKLRMMNLCVSKAFLRNGVGEQIIVSMKRQLSRIRRSSIVLDVRESNLVAQQFFRSQGFKATGIAHDFYDENSEDAFMFEYQIPECGELS